MGLNKSRQENIQKKNDKKCGIFLFEKKLFKQENIKINGDYFNRQPGQTIIGRYIIRLIKGLP